jgi:hypothetical protein
MDQLKFYDRYRQYSTADLINIVREKDHYESAAVLAAEQLLQERKVSFSDQEEADRVQPQTRTPAELRSQKWYRIFLVVYGLWCARDLYRVVRYFIQTQRMMELGLEDLVYNGVILAQDALLFVLIIQKRRWGWILMAAVNTMMFFINLTFFVEMLKFRLIGVNAMPDLYSALFNLAVVAFLWRRATAEFFGVEPVIRRWALGVGFGVGVILSGYSLFTQR